MSALPPGEPPDGGWGWLVVLAGFLANSLTYGVLRCLGILFEDLMGAFDASTAQVSWVTAIALATEQLASPIGTAASMRFGARPVVMVGGLFSSLGILWASFSTDLLQLYLALGFLTGFLRDLTGNFTASFLVGGAFVLCASGVFLALPSFFASCRRSEDPAAPSTAGGLMELGPAGSAAPFLSASLASRCSEA